MSREKGFDFGGRGHPLRVRSTYSFLLATLCFVFLSASSVATATSVDIGPDNQTVQLDSNGTAVATINSNFGLDSEDPEITWTLESSNPPGLTVTFGYDSQWNRTVTCTAAGTYVIRCTVSENGVSVFDQVTVTVIDASRDSDPPLIAVTDTKLSINATASAGNTVSAVQIGGLTATPNNGLWEATVPVSSGVNNVTVVVTDNQGNQHSSVVTIEHAAAP